MNILKSENLTFLILPGSPMPWFSSLYLDRQKKAYDYWKSYWQSLLSEINPGEKLNSEYFFDQDIFCVIYDGSEIVAMQSLKYYDLRCGLQDHSVFAPFTPDFWQFLKQKNVQRVFTGRWFRVADEYSARKTGVSFAAVVMELALKIYDFYKANDVAYIAHSRTDIGACNLAKKFGWFEVGERQMLHGVPCAQIVLLDKRERHENLDVNRLAKLLWEQRINLTTWKEIDHGKEQQGHIAA